MPREFPQPYPPAFIRAWAFDILDDRTTHVLERDRPGLGAGTRSSLRLPIRFGERVIAGIGFNSVQPARFSNADVAIARRLADYVADVAVALSPRRGKRGARLRSASARPTSRCSTSCSPRLTGVLDVRDVFDRVSAIADRVLPHDALSIAEVIDNGDRVRIHASHGLGELPEPYDIDTPDRTMLQEPWDFRLIDDVRERPEYAHGPGWAAGMRSMMFVAIRFEGKLFGGLNFYSQTPGRYTKDDVLIARRITDHVALALSHRRLADEARQIEELRARTTSIELLDELLAALVDSGDLPDVFGRVLDDRAEGAAARRGVADGAPAGRHPRKAVRAQRVHGAAAANQRGSARAAREPRMGSRHLRRPVEVQRAALHAAGRHGPAVADSRAHSTRRRSSPAR